MSHRRPNLHKPHLGWQRDLPPPAEEFTSEVRSHSQPVINALDGAFLEISRRSTKMRGLMLFISGFGFFLLADSVPRLHAWWTVGSGSPVTPIGAFLVDVILIFFCVRIDTAIPRDEPIRFNRLRRKVYVYSFHYILWNPFARWYVTTRAYNWDDLRAEVWRQRGATAQGGLIFTWGVSIAVVKPGTNQVIDRFPLSVGQDEGSSWDYVRAYMQHGPNALPPVDTFNDPDEVPPYNLALRLAPKVRWPAEIDAESRSGQDDPAIAQNAN
ncbi:MAG: hypothetical protein QHC88_02640 [Achromobacter sp.]|uniref:DUF6708 domain-containing protein n=1 Tax=Achromobacter sp. TaxID=134375 RepID=UPI0029BD43BF|nr:DUF6708 domain-containing protein [Achromobacter sp.]MDX3984129.1 hypothetical protein [Achromobacter sp.]